MPKNKASAKDKQDVDERLETVDENDIPAADADAATEVEGGGEAETIEVSADEYRRLQEELADLRGRIVRQQADFDNTRKRLRAQAEQSGQRALARFVGSLLIELDNFDHALKAANPDKFQDFAMGVTMIHQNLLTVLNGSGIELISCEGVFDPAFHEVVQEVEDADLPRGTIKEVLRQGYKLGDQVVRAAQVVVSRLPRAEEEAEVAAADEE